MRVSWRFSADGRYAACLAAAEGDVFRPEVWDFTGPGPLVRPLASACDATTQISPLDGERALLCRNDDGRHRISLVTQSTETTLTAGRGPYAHLTGDLVTGDAVHRRDRRRAGETRRSAAGRERPGRRPRAPAPRADPAARRRARWC